MQLFVPQAMRSGMETYMWVRSGIPNKKWGNFCLWWKAVGREMRGATYPTGFRSVFFEALRLTFLMNA